MMPELRTVAGLATAALLLAACGSGPTLGSGDGEAKVDAPPLSAAEVRVYLSDATLTSLEDDLARLEYFSPDGRLEGYWRASSMSSGRAQGSWEVQEDGRLCRRWEGGWTGQNGCVEVRRQGDAYLLVPPDGDPANAVRALRSPGNDTSNKT